MLVLKFAFGHNNKAIACLLLYNSLLHASEYV